MNDMRRINVIVRHPLYREHYARLEKAEEGRKYCRHQIQHLLDVARIAYIRNLEQNFGISKDVIYAAALLHDIGKAAQYEENIPHEIAGETIAAKILDCFPDEIAFTQEEKRMILTAIRGHRELRPDAEVLERLLYESDKASRICFACPEEGECSWSDEKKNMEIRI